MNILKFLAGGYRQGVRTYYKDSLGLPNQKIVLAVVQFIYRKGYDLLLNAAVQLQERDVCIVLIGGNEPEEFERFIEKHDLSNVFFGFST